MIESFNPANQQLIRTFEVTSEESIDSLIQQTKMKQHDGFFLEKKNQEKVAKELINQIDHKKDKLAELISKENGKPLRESIAEIEASITKIRLTMDAHADRLLLKKISKNKKIMDLSYKPLGIMSVIGPFNFPFYLPLGQIFPALLAGNGVIFKPSELTTSVGYALMECFERTCLLKGLINIVVGKKEQVTYLVSHNDINGVLFTGSYKTAQQISKIVALTPEKLLALECGGNNPLIVMSYKSIQDVSNCLIQSTFLTSGQRCTCTRRLIVKRSKKNEQLINLFLQDTKNISIGSYTSNPEPFMGPLITDNSVENVLKTYKLWLKLGGNSLIAPKKVYQKGNFVSPGIVDVTSCYKIIPDEECFGPLCQLIWVDSLDEAINVANETNYGLSASIISTEKKEFEQTKKLVNAGIINWNQATNGASGLLPFGGVGCSGNYRPAGYWMIDSCVYPVASVQNQIL